MRYLASLILILSLFSCKTGEQIVDTSKFPQWLQERPNDSDYYIGIGSARKIGNPAEYMEAARINALGDMSKAISVNVNAQTSNVTSEDERGFRENFMADVKTKSAEIFQDVKVNDQFDDGQRYYVYCSISKVEFMRQKEERKAKAIAKGLSFFEQAVQQEQEGHITNALSFYVKTVDALVFYANESTKANTSKGEYDLISESRNSFIRIVNEIKIRPESDDIRLKRGSQSKNRKIKFDIVYNSESVKNLPAKFKYTGGYLPQNTDISDLEGQVEISVRVSKRAKSVENLEVKFDLEALVRKATTNMKVRRSFHMPEVPKYTQEIHIESPTVKYSFTDGLDNSVALMKEVLEDNGIEESSNADFKVSLDIKGKVVKKSFGCVAKYTLYVNVKSRKDRNRQREFKYIFEGENKNGPKAFKIAMRKLDNYMKGVIPRAILRNILQ
ncbi:MAG: LPP20 family lipoprotein [Marinifilaceae bacterium]|jgi:hypothetical protein|nr:LPP20 family lipoprotein [Marinifilaceae bacterium]